MSQPGRNRQRKQVLVVLFLVSSAVSLLLWLFWWATSTAGAGPGEGATADLTGVVALLGALATCCSAAASLGGLALTATIERRRDRREAAAAGLERRRLGLELERQRRELEGGRAMEQEPEPPGRPDGEGTGATAGNGEWRGGWWRSVGQQDAGGPGGHEREVLSAGSQGDCKVLHDAGKCGRDGALGALRAQLGHRPSVNGEGRSPTGTQSGGLCYGRWVMSRLADGFAMALGRVVNCLI